MNSHYFSSRLGEIQDGGERAGGLLLLLRPDALEPAPRDVAPELVDIERGDEFSVGLTLLRMREADVLIHSPGRMPPPQLPETCDDGACAMLAAIAVDQEWILGLIDDETKGFAHELVGYTVAKCLLVTRHTDLDELDVETLGPVHVLSRQRLVLHETDDRAKIQSLQEPVVARLGKGGTVEVGVDLSKVERCLDDARVDFLPCHLNCVILDGLALLRRLSQLATTVRDLTPELFVGGYGLREMEHVW